MTPETLTSNFIGVDIPRFLAALDPEERTKLLEVEPRERVRAFLESTFREIVVLEQLAAFLITAIPNLETEPDKPGA
jgi:hypothetical protein